MTGPVQVGNGTIAPIGHTASLNIQAVLKAKGIDVGAELIEKSIRDEINMMSAHFSLAVSEAQDHFESEVIKVKAQFANDLAQIKSDFVWLKANKVKVASVGSALVAIGALIAHFV